MSYQEAIHHIVDDGLKGSRMREGILGKGSYEALSSIHFKPKSKAIICKTLGDHSLGRAICPVQCEPFMGKIVDLLHGCHYRHLRVMRIRQ